MNVLKTYPISTQILTTLPQSYGEPSTTALRNLVNTAFFMTSEIDKLHDEHYLIYYLNHERIQPCNIASESAFQGPQEEISVLVNTLIYDRMQALNEKYDFGRGLVDTSITTLAHHIGILADDHRLFYEERNTPVEVIIPIGQDVEQMVQKMQIYQEPKNVHNVYTDMILSA